MHFTFTFFCDAPFIPQATSTPLGKMTTGGMIFLLLACVLVARASLTIAAPAPAPDAAASRFNHPHDDASPQHSSSTRRRRRTSPWKNEAEKVVETNTRKGHERRGRTTENDGRDEKKKIRHVVVLMEENRSFDHLLGWYLGTKRGLTGNESNPINENNATEGVVRVSPSAHYINECDPNHSLGGTSYKVFGRNAFYANNLTTPWMNGFVQFEKDFDQGGQEGKRYCGVMEGFNSSAQLPVMTALAENFVLFDAFFASVPGPTWPNRMFFLSGTSMGLTETQSPWYQNRVGQLFPQRTIFDQVAATNGSWRLYYNDTPWELMLQTVANHPEHTLPLTQFYDDARNGQLPTFAFINPRAGVNLTLGLGSNDQHPDHDVALGEALYKDVYEALRASPQWNETLFVLTYDEHGGFYDHVAPPSFAPSPGRNEPTSYPDKDFYFNRGGMRIVTLLASPWLPKGRVVSDPPAHAKPSENSVFELTSVMATVRKLIPGMETTPSLTERDAWAANFAYLFDELSEPRTDCPVHLPDAPTAGGGAPGALMREAHSGINELQYHIATLHAAAAAAEEGSDGDIDADIRSLQLQHEFGTFVQTRYQTHRERVALWKASKKEDAHPSVSFKLRVLRAYYAEPFATNISKRAGVEAAAHEGIVRRNASSAPYVTIHANVTTEQQGTNQPPARAVSYCLDAGAVLPVVGLRLQVSVCFPSSNPARNRDPAQQFYYDTDNTIRPYSDPSLCATSGFLRGESTIVWKKCALDTIAVEQSWSYQGSQHGGADDLVRGLQIGAGIGELFILRRNSSEPHVSS